MRRNSAFLLVGVMLSALAGSAGVLGADNNVGTWKMNPAKSKYSPGPGPKSQTLKIEPWGDDGVNYSSDGIGTDGKPTHTEFSAKYDGKDYPFKGNPDADTLAYTRIDSNTVEATLKKGGKIVQRAKAVVSKDGKVRTLTQTGKDVQGRDINNTVVYEKQ